MEASLSTTEACWMREGPWATEGDGKIDVWRRDVEVGRAKSGSYRLRSGLAGTVASTQTRGNPAVPAPRQDG